MPTHTDPAPVKREAYEVLRLPEFRYFAASRLFVTLATQIQAVAVAWQVYSLTKDPLSLGLIALAEVIPAISCSLFAGHIVDRSDRRSIVSMGLGIGLISTLLLCILSSGILQISTSRLIALFYVAAFIGGIARAFLSSSQFALFAQIVPKKLFVSAAAWNTTAWQIAAAAGPALGGLLYGFAGARFTYALALGLMILSLVAVTLITKKGKPVPSGAPEPLFKSLKSGLNFVFGNSLILTALSLDMFAVLFGGAVALLPIFADFLHTGPQGLGLLRAAPSIGSLSMAFFIAHRPMHKRAGQILLCAVASFGLCMIAFGLSRNFYFSFFILLASGAFDNISVIVRATVLQLLTPDHMRGRVSAVNSIFIGSSNEIGAFESGLTAKWLGATPAVVLGGCLTLVVVGVTAAIAPQMRKLNLAKLTKD